MQRAVWVFPKYKVRVTFVLKWCQTIHVLNENFLVFDEEGVWSRELIHFEIFKKMGHSKVRLITHHNWMQGKCNVSGNWLEVGEPSATPLVN